MQSKLAERLHLRYEPAAILFSDEKPSDARTYPDGQWVCAAAMLSAAMRGSAVNAGAGIKRTALFLRFCSAFLR